MPTRTRRGLGLLLLGLATGFLSGGVLLAIDGPRSAPLDALAIVLTLIGYVGFAIAIAGFVFIVWGLLRD